MGGTQNTWFCQRRRTTITSYVLSHEHKRTYYNFYQIGYASWFLARVELETRNDRTAPGLAAFASRTKVHFLSGFPIDGIGIHEV